MFRNYSITLGVVGAMFLSVGSASAAATYELTPLQCSGWRQSYVDGINNSGQIVGSYNVTGASWPEFLYSAGSVMNLGDLETAQK